MANLYYVQTPAVTLYTGMAAADTSCRITPYPVDLDGNKLVTADFGDNPTFTIDPKVSGFEEICYFTAIVDNGDNTATLTGLTRDLTSKYPYTTAGTGKTHGSSAIVVFGANPQTFGAIIAYINAVAIAGAPDASTTVKGIVKMSVAPVSSTAPIALGQNDPIITAPKSGTPLNSSTNKIVDEAYLTSIIPTGIVSPYSGRSAPTGWLLCDGSAVSRSTYAALLAVIAPSGTFTVTIASPGVFTKTGHGYVAGDKVHVTTTGGLPSGLVANTDYYIISAGLTANAFELALSPGGAAIVTTGSQSGVHTVYASAFGKGDGSTTFNVPDFRSRLGIGLAATAPTTSLSFEPAAVSAGSDNVTIINTVFPSQGQKVQLTSTGTLPAGLSLATDYWIVRSSSTTIKFAADQAGANGATPSVVDITDQGTGVHTLTFTNITHTVLGKYGGEDTHGNSTGELAGHTHSGTFITTGSSNNGFQAGSSTNTGTASTGAAGSNTQHNNMQPYVVVNYIIKT